MTPLTPLCGSGGTCLQLAATGLSEGVGGLSSVPPSSALSCGQSSLSSSVSGSVSAVSCVTHNSTALIALPPCMVVCASTQRASPPSTSAVRAASAASAPG